MGLALDGHQTDTSYLASYVHFQGFLEAAKLLLDAGLNKTIEEMAEAGVELVEFSGYDMGGAIATLLTVLLWHNVEKLNGTKIKFRLVTFGAPRVGDKALMDQVEMSTGGAIDCCYTLGDPVPHIFFAIYHKLRLRNLTPKSIMMQQFVEGVSKFVETLHCGKWPVSIPIASVLSL